MLNVVTYIHPVVKAEEVFEIHVTSTNQGDITVLVIVVQQHMVTI